MSQYLLGLDGGGTKVHAIIGNEKGEILAQGFGGPGNYQTCGQDQCRASMMKAVGDCLTALSISIDDLAYGVFGLSGYDEPQDFQVLDPLVHSIMGQVPHKVMHDSWIGLRSVSEENFGVVSICGTGGATTGRNKEGQTIALRNLGYIFGNRGGGHELVEKAIHFAFRSEEGTYDKSSLEVEIPKCFGLSNMAQVADALREEEWPEPQVAHVIPPMVFEEALKGDHVAVELLQDMGITMGQYAGGLIKRLGMEDMEVPCVMIGSLFKQKHPVLHHAYLGQVRKTAPKAYGLIPDLPPAYGAYYLAMDAVSRKGNK